MTSEGTFCVLRNRVVGFDIGDTDAHTHRKREGEMESL